MFLVVLKFVHIFFGVVGIGYGAWVLRGVLCGKLFKKWALLFLLCALITSASGLLFPLHGFLLVRWAAMSAVYVAGVAVFAWRRYGLAGIWSLLFALSTLLVLCLDVEVAIEHVFVKLLPTQPQPLFLISELMVMLLFVCLGLFTVKRYRASQVEPKVQPLVNECD